jgi:1-pyrroline-5-carboxylate dehydrogenase
MAGVASVPAAKNEPVKAYAPGSPERASLKAELERMAGEVAEIPLVIGGKPVTTGDLNEIVMPHDHQTVIGRAHKGTAAHVERAIHAAKDARAEWAAMEWEQRASIFLKAADLMAGPWRDRANAATMLGQSKTVFQSEIDAVCELADFWRFNVEYMRGLMADQPFSPPGQWNRVELRPLDGFVFAITPFNFTSIGGNLPTAPAIMGNTVLWKPATTQMRSAWTIMQILEEAGLPPGVINLIHGPSKAIGDVLMSSPELGGLHFTGSVPVFQQLYASIGRNIDRYHQFPRVVGETGGKDFVFAHASADLAALSCAIVRGGFEYQGQKCSAVSRVYVPKSIWRELRERLVADVDKIKVGDVRDFSVFMGAVIDQPSYKKITSYVTLASGDASCRVLAGGTFNDSRGWFIQPCLVETSDPRHRLMREEIFGPVVTVWAYDEAKIDEALALCDSSTPFALTGAVFARDRAAIDKIGKRLSGAAGNFYINDKPTGAVVGQQPFGGGRISGTNDKAGSVWNLMRWASPRAIKETFVPPTDIRYPHMDAP